MISNPGPMQCIRCGGEIAEDAEWAFFIFTHRNHGKCCSRNCRQSAARQEMQLVAQEKDVDITKIDEIVDLIKSVTGWDPMAGGEYGR